MAFLNAQLEYARSSFARALAMGIVAPSKAAAELKEARKIMDKARSYALGSTAKFFRLAMRGSFKDNRFGWRENTLYPQWFGKFGAVNVAGLVKANKPRRGKKRVNPPSQVNIGGKLPRIIFHSIDESAGSMVVGVIPQKIKGGGGTWEDVFERFQSGGKVEPGPMGSYASMKRYLFAIGIFTKGQLKRPARPLIAPLQAQNPPQEKFNERFLARLNR